MYPITTKENKVMDFIKNYISSNGRSPSYVEIQRYFGFVSINSVFKNIQSLLKKGYITKDSTCRSIKVL